MIKDFEEWIRMGAPDPREAVPAEQAAARPVPETDLWSLQPIRRVTPPAVREVDWRNNAIDRFVHHRLRAAGIQPVPVADVHTLLRRLSFDLTGLPPAPDRIARFVAETRSGFDRAWRAAVEEMLADKAFGERWGRHWLDVARYAESNGQSRDVLFPHAWRYRDWVVNAFNADLPFDRFVTEQIAGDLLPTDDPDLRRSRRIATGFLAIGSKPLSGGNLTHDLVDDQIDVVTRGFLGLTVSCARCHDHKFDPVPTADYYALSGIFQSTKTFYGGGTRRPRNLGDKLKVWMPLEEVSAAEIKRIAALEKQRAPITKRIKTYERKVGMLKRARKPNEASIAKEEKRIADDRQKLAEIDRELEQLKVDLAMGVSEAGKTVDARILVRGEPREKGDPVSRGFLSCVQLDNRNSMPAEQSGRLELARWITHPDNPLTARVAVNRTWLHLFGRGLVESVDNLGATGSKPTHPQLLDWLARQFVADGWSVKKLIRRIVTSRTYRASSSYAKAAYQADAANHLLWRANRRRLEVEAIHDALLAAGGVLIADKPATSAVARIGEGEVGRGLNEAPLREPFRHRGIYLPVLRTAMIDIHKTFDFPDPGTIQGRRDVTNVPTQSLFFMNDPLVAEMAAAAAGRAAAAKDPVRFAFLLLFGRPPTTQEAASARDFITEKKADGPVSLCHALIASAEFRFLR